MFLLFKKAVDRIVDFFAVSLLVLMVGACFYQVTARYVFSNPPDWTEEVARYAFVWITFLGGAIACRGEAHLGVDALVNLFPKKVQQAISFLITAITIVVLLILITKGIKVVTVVSRQLWPALRYSMAFPYLAIPVGASLMVLEMVYLVLKKLRHRETE